MRLRSEIDLLPQTGGGALVEAAEVPKGCEARYTMPFSCLYMRLEQNWLGDNLHWKRHCFWKAEHNICFIASHLRAERNRGLVTPARWSSRHGCELHTRT